VNYKPLDEAVKKWTCEQGHREIMNLIEVYLDTIEDKYRGMAMTKNRPTEDVATISDTKKHS